MKKNKDPRKLHVGKNKIDKDNYQRFLNSDFKLDQTEKDLSTTSSDTSTIDSKNSIEKPKKRPKTFKQKMAKNFEDNWLLWILGIFSTIIIGLFGWLFNNDYNFNADLKVAENNISHIETQISDYKNNGTISKDEYIDIEKEIQNIKSSYAKLENMNELEKNYEVFKTSIEKDIEYLQKRVNAIKE
jgi:hypothetical protein